MNQKPAQTVQPVPWRGAKRWVYSITFDEALVDLHRFAVPILEEYHCPGHLEVVVGQMGEVRKIFDSSYNGMRHMNAAELREMLAMGWGVGNHSWSHTLLNHANFDRELGQARQVLEDAIGEPVTIYCSPGNNENMSEDVLDSCRELGYLGAMSIYEALNRPEDRNLMWLNRVYLHENGPITHDAEFDPFRKILHAIKDGGWIIDYCHCPLEQAVHPRKDCSAAQLRQRLQAVTEYGKEDVWLGKVEEVVDYRYAYRCLEMQSSGRTDELLLSLRDLPKTVQHRILTLQLPEDTRAVELDDETVGTYSFAGKKLLDVDLSTRRRLHLLRTEEITGG